MFYQKSRSLNDMLLNTHQQGYIDIYKNNVVFHELQRMNSKILKKGNEGRTPSHGQEELQMYLHQTMIQRYKCIVYLHHQCFYFILIPNYVLSIPILTYEDHYKKLAVHFYRRKHLDDL